MKNTYLPGKIIDKKDLLKTKTQKIRLYNEVYYLITTSDNNNIKMKNDKNILVGKAIINNSNIFNTR